MANQTGYIKLYKSLLDWEWYKDANTKAVFFHLLLMANYKPTEYKNIIIDRGECVITVKEICDSLNLTAQQTRTALEHLKSTNNITIKTTNKYSVVTVVSYDKWQGKSTNKTTLNQQTKLEKSTNLHIIKENNKEIKKYNNTHTYAYARGKYENVFLTEDETAELIANWGEERFNDSVEELSAYMYDKPDFKSEHHIVPLTTWIQDRLNDRANKKARVQTRDAEKKSKADKAKAAGFDFEFDDIYERV
jgi:hypothetical protein